MNQYVVGHERDQSDQNLILILFLPQVQTLRLNVSMPRDGL
jgi:hypothetical protein